MRQGQRDRSGEEQDDGEEVERAALRLALRGAEGAEHLEEREGDGHRHARRAPPAPASRRTRPTGARGPSLRRRDPTAATVPGHRRPTRVGCEGWGRTWDQPRDAGSGPSSAARRRSAYSRGSTSASAPVLRGGQIAMLTGKVAIQARVATSTTHPATVITHRSAGCAAWSLMPAKNSTTA